MFRSELHLQDTGLAFRCGAALLRPNSDAPADAGATRIALLLAIAYRAPVYQNIFDHLDAALKFWNNNDKAAANFRLMFAGLAELDDQEAIDRLIFAERLLDSGVPPALICDALDAMDEMGKFDRDQRRVPAGNGIFSGRWASVWSAVQQWLNAPVPEYDLDKGEQVGTRTRARALLTNPLTVGAAATAALLGAEALLPAAAGEALAPASEAAAPAAVEEALAPTAASRDPGRDANTARGLASEAKVLEELGLMRNTKAVRTAEGSSVPDALTDRLSIEIKDRAYVSGTKQIRIQTDAAKIRDENLSW